MSPEFIASSEFDRDPEVARLYDAAQQALALRGNERRTMLHRLAADYEHRWADVVSDHCVVYFGKDMVDYFESGYRVQGYMYGFTYMMYPENTTDDEAHMVGAIGALMMDSHSYRDTDYQHAWRSLLGDTTLQELLRQQRIDLSHAPVAVPLDDSTMVKLD